MAIYKEDIIDIELNSGSIHRSFLNHAIGAEDEKANRFGVRTFRNGLPEEIGGTCFGLFIRADGATVVIENGVCEGNVAYVTLPEACYAVEGQFTLAIKCQGENVTGTMRIVDGTVSRTSTEAIVDPGTIIPSVEDLIEAINDAIESIPADYSELTEEVEANKKESVQQLGAMNAVENTGMVGAAWVSGAIVSNEDGTLITTEGYSTTESLIPIPQGAITHLKMAYNAFRIALYDREQEFISAEDITSVTHSIPEDSAAFFRVSYHSEDIELDDGRFACWFEYPAGIVAKTSMLEGKTDDAPVSTDDLKFRTTKDYYAGEYVIYLNQAYRFDTYHAAGVWNSNEVTKVPADSVVETVHGERNPAVLDGCAEGPFAAIRMSSQGSGKHVTICGKNLFKMAHPDKVQFISGGVTFQYDHENGSIRVSSSGATANQPSAGSTFPAECQSVNGVSGIYNNFRFRFKHDTVIAVSANCSERQFYNDLIQMRLTDGTTWYEVDESGLMIKAAGGTEYGLQILVRNGWSGDVTFYPQVEIGSHPTAREAYDGVRLTLPTVGGYDNIYKNAELETGSLVQKTNGITAVFSPESAAVYISGTAPENINVTVFNKNGSVNGESAYYIHKFTLNQDRLIALRAIPKNLAGVMYGYITDGTTRWEDHGDGVILEGESGKEYGFGIIVMNGATVETVLHPVIATDIRALEQYGAKRGRTVIYTDDDTVIRAAAKKAARSDVIEAGRKALEDLRTLTGNRTPLIRLGRKKPILTLIDDDTKSVALVERYHDILAELGVVGNYAVETYNVDAADGLEELLLEYEQEGFGCIYHCYYQSGDATRYWIHGHPDYDEDLIKENFMTGLRRIAEYGLSNYKFWVTPYGVNDDFIVSLAKTHGMQCLFTCPSVNFPTYGYIGMGGGNGDRWNIPRISYESSSNDDKIKQIIDACAADNGWLNIVTHANTWGSGTTMDERFSAIVQYCIGKGYDVVSVPEAYETFKPVFYMNELL